MSALHLKERESVPPPPPTTNTKRHIYTDSYTQTPTHTQTAVHTDTHRQTEAETSHLEGQQLEWSCGTQTQDDQKPIHARAAWQKEYESEPLLERQSERTSNRVHRPVHTSNTKHTKHTATPQTHTDRHTKHTKHTKHKTRTQTQTHTHHRQTHTQTDRQTDRQTHTHTHTHTSPHANAAGSAEWRVTIDGSKAARNVPSGQLIEARAQQGAGIHSTRRHVVLMRRAKRQWWANGCNG